MRFPTLAAAMAALLLGVTACGGTEAADAAGPAVSATNPDAGGALGMCAPDVTDCVDVVVDTDSPETYGP